MILTAVFLICKAFAGVAWSWWWLIVTVIVDFNLAANIRS